MSVGGPALSSCLPEATSHRYTFPSLQVARRIDLAEASRNSQP